MMGSGQVAWLAADIAGATGMGTAPPPFAICPPPGDGNELPFIVLIALREGITRSYSYIRGTSVSVFPLTATEIRRDVRSCAHPSSTLL
jgi:hypothetical protein